MLDGNKSVCKLYQIVTRGMSGLFEIVTTDVFKLYEAVSRDVVQDVLDNEQRCCLRCVRQ